MSAISEYLALFKNRKPEREKISAVRQTILDRLLYVFSLLGLPAAVVGASQAYFQGRRAFCFIYLSIYLLFLLATFGSRRFPYTVRSLVLVASLYLIALAVLFRIGLSGVGPLLLMGVCFMASVFFGFRWGIFVILMSLTGMGLVAAGMTTGLIQIFPEHMLTSVSTVAWLTSLCVFFMIVSITVVSSEMFRKGIEESIDLLEEHKERLEINNQHLLQEIEERKKAEVKTKQLGKYLENIINSMPSILVGVDGESRVNQWNLAAEKMTGISGADAQGQMLDQVMPMLNLDFEKVRKAIGNRKVMFQAKVSRPEAGTVHYDDITIYPLVTDGVEGAVIRVDDVTERVRMEEMMIQSEKMLSVGGLAAGMAHEINNPLGIILQTSQNVLRRLSPDLPANISGAEACGTNLEKILEYLKKREILVFLEDIRKSGERAAKIVSNMLNFSRKAEGGGNPTNLGDLLDRTLALAESDYNLKKNYDFRQIEIVREYETDVPLPVCQSGKIQQFFLNILRNGAEAMNEQHEKNTGQDSHTEAPLFVLRVMRDGNMVRVEIEDNGPGMDDATQKRIFEPFFTTKPPGYGTGLGLSVSYFIISEEHGGNLLVDSIPGAGARFTVLLPIREQAEELANIICSKSIHP